MMLFETTLCQESHRLSYYQLHQQQANICRDNRLLVVYYIYLPAQNQMEIVGQFVW